MKTPFEILVALALLSLSHCHAATIRTKADMRLWETVADRSAPLSWPWEEGADSATLVFSNCVTRTIASAVVQRVAGEMRGSYAQPAPQEGEGLVAVVVRIGDIDQEIIRVLDHIPVGIQVVCPQLVRHQYGKQHPYEPEETSHRTRSFLPGRSVVLVVMPLRAQRFDTVVP